MKWNKITKEYRDHPNVLAVHYEELIESPEKTLKKVFAFIEEPYNESLLDFASRERSWYSRKNEKDKAKPFKAPAEKPSAKQQEELRNWQINQPLFDGRKRWEKEMLPEEHEKFAAVASTTMKELGYEMEPIEDIRRKSR